MRRRLAMWWDYNAGIVFGLALVALIVAVALGVGWYAAGMEAKAYNRITGSDVTQAEAFWINLRVDCN